jgi:ParB family chromosome partitioning protein
MGLRDKASKIDFASLPGSAAAVPVSAPVVPGAVQPAGDVKRPKTAPGAMMALAVEQRSELVQENDALKAQLGDLSERVRHSEMLEGELAEALDELKGWEGAKATRLIDPRLIARSRWANRHSMSFDTPEFLALKEEIRSAGGNVQPVKVRPLTGAEAGEGARYELVYGHRRHEACLQLGLPVLALVDNLDDTSLFVEMDRENRARANLAPWEQGVMYLRALEQGLFASNRKLAEAVGADLSNVGKALELARLPAFVLEAFASPLELQYRWAAPLRDALAADKQGVERRARKLASHSPKLKAAEVFARLLAGDVADEGSTVLPPETIAVDVRGKRAAAIRLAPGGAVVVNISPGQVDANRLGELRSLLERFLGGAQ